ncbi:hypothetical protein D1159_12585 [Pseudoflavonifractor sp. 524-17]|uniref:hypothetical protein n=1 Tax=Pseudoflavonifractor sp. 524-17 TaxID=2304577 RepID=UPI00137A21E0|nr:hypothetical protein [Pseudoflavonifractor sp. 524-17]NCE65390.1 hypothetical protein [Pseudoflavonifractor sp. 524-17]
MNIQELLAGGGGLLLVLMTLVQIAPIKITPWSAFAKAVGKAVNADISHRLGGIEAKLDHHIDMDDRRTADSRRVQILHFNNELLRPIDHTKEEFVEVLAKIDDYERYCEEHPDYPNNRAVLAIENIREVYRERLKKRDFLQESRAKDEAEAGQE